MLDRYIRDTKDIVLNIFESEREEVESIGDHLTHPCDVT